MYKPLKSFKGKTNKIKDDIKLAYDDLDCGSCEPHSDNHLRLRKMFNNTNVSLVQGSIDYHRFIPICHKDHRVKLKKYFEKLKCGFYERNKTTKTYDFYEWTLFETLKVEFKKKKIVYLMFDALNYGIEEENKKKDYEHHSLVVIFIPLKKGYHAYLINSHGVDTKDYTTYERFTSIYKRQKTINYDFHNNIDVVMMKDFIDFFKLSTKIKIRYNKTENHNYHGANLQHGDNYGVCCLFPTIIWYYFNLYYKKTVKLGQMKFDTSINMLKKNQLIPFIHLIFTDFDSKYETKLLTIMKNTNCPKKVDRMVEKLNYRFTKKILNMTVAFLSQKYFKC